MNYENYEIDLADKNISYYQNANGYRNKEKEILNSMKESLDNFLLNLKTKSTSNNITQEEIENYYLSKSDIYNTLNVDLISSYQSLLKQSDLRKNNNIRKNMSKRANSSKALLHKANSSVINNNSIYNNLNQNNSFYDKNTSELKHNNSMFFNESDAFNAINKKRRMNKNVNNKINYTQNNYSINNNSAKYFQNKQKY